MAKKLVVNGLWLVVNGELASCKVKLLYSFLKSDCTTEENKVKSYIDVLCMFTEI